MTAKKILVIVGLIGLILLSGVTTPASACDPRNGDIADCPSTPTATFDSAAVPTPVTTLIATGKSSPDALAVLSVPGNLGLPFPLSCLLPDGDNPSNALGVAEVCPALPVTLRTVKATPPPPTAALKVAVAPTAISPKGDSPGSAKTIVDAWQTIDPGGIHWYKIDNGKNFYLDVYVDTHGVSGITLAMYAPEQSNDLSVNLPPKGRGAPVKNEPHDLLWKGSYATGVWYALVRNYNSAPVQYKLGIVQSSTDRNCVGYWEVVSGVMTWWVDCGHYQNVDTFGK